MTNMPRLAEIEPLPQLLGCEAEPSRDSAAVAQLVAMLEEICRIQKQHRVRLMLVERSLRNLRRRVGEASRPAARQFY